MDWADKLISEKSIDIGGTEYVRSAVAAQLLRDERERCANIVEKVGFAKFAKRIRESE